MYQKVKAYVEKYHMLTSDDKVIAGVSGGADSICLLFVLLKLREEMGFDIVAVHVHHGIRGESADADETYVREICRREGVPVTVFRKDVLSYAKERGMTEEEAGREVRRQAFMQVLKEQKGTRIALAHHMNDNAETLLWNLCRGTGLKGLGGIAPVSGVWIRPLLCVKRADIESYLENMGISYCTDETNFQNTYTRNRIRNKVLPCLEKNINEQTVRHMAETAEQMWALGEYIAGEVRHMREKCTRQTECGELLLEEKPYRALPEELKPYVVHEIICEAAGHRKDIAAVHVRLVRELLERQVGRRVSLPYGITAVRCYEGVNFAKGNQTKENDPRGDFTFRIIEAGDSAEVFPENPYTKWFDYDIIKNTVKMRHRKPGDYLTIDKNGRTQKLRQYFINEKIPQDTREGIWLAADGPHIMWVVGYRQNQMYQVTDKTRRILEIRYYGGENNGRNGKNNA